MSENTILRHRPTSEGCQPGLRPAHILAGRRSGTGPDTRHFHRALLPSEPCHLLHLRLLFQSPVFHVSRAKDDVPCMAMDQDVPAAGVASSLRVVLTRPFRRIIDDHLLCLSKPPHELGCGECRRPSVSLQVLCDNYPL